MKACEYCMNAEDEGHADWCPDKDHPEAGFTEELCDYCSEIIKEGHADWCPEIENSN